MLDYPSLRAVALIVQTGSFEKAAQIMNVTPSAISQRIKLLEERLGTVLIERGTPCLATENGEWLCRHMEHIGLLEQELFKQLPSLANQVPDGQKATLHIATNADSLATWFLEPVSNFAKTKGYLLDIAVDDQHHTASWLRRGRVTAAVTALKSPVQGCRIYPLGALRFHATASPDFFQQYFKNGVTPDSLIQAPTLTFNQKDHLQDQWLQQTMGQVLFCQTHWLPSTHSFVEAAVSGLGWCMNPSLLVNEHLKTGRLVEIIPDTPLDIPLFWQVSRLAEGPLEGLTREIISAARNKLVQ